MAAVSSEPLQSPCGCYKCTREEYDYTDDGEKLVVNNVHGELQPCETCGRAKPSTSITTRGRVPVLVV